MRFDMSGMSQAFDKMRENAKSRGRDMANDQANYFTRVLKAEGRKIAPTRERIYNDVKAADFKIKRKPGVSVSKEIKRRFRAIGTFARGWMIDRIENSDLRIRIWVKNKSAESLKVDNMKGVSDKAEKAVGGRFKQRLERMADQIMKVF